MGDTPISTVLAERLDAIDYNGVPVASYIYDGDTGIDNGYDLGEVLVPVDAVAVSGGPTAFDAITYGLARKCAVAATQAKEKARDSDSREQIVSRAESYLAGEFGHVGEKLQAAASTVNAGHHFV